MADGRRVLVTGGAGFIGSHLTRHLSDRGANVHAVDDLSAGRESLLPDDVTLIRMDVRSNDFRTVAREFSPEALVHLAAKHYIPDCNENPHETFEVNVMGTQNVLDVAREVDSIDTVVFASSAAVYPPRAHPNEEMSRTGPIGIYGQTKLVAENLVRLFARETSTKAVSARLFNVYGSNETNDHLIPAIVNQLRDGTDEIELGNVTPRRDFVHVTDVARALTRMLTAYDGSYRTFNVGTGTEYSVLEVAQKAISIAGGDVDIVRDESRMRETDREHLRADITRITNELGWEPRVDFGEGLRELLTEEATSASGRPSSTHSRK